MKKTTLIKTKYSFIFTTLLITLFVLSSSSSAQFQNNGTVFIGDNGFLFYESGSFNFGATTQTTTTRTAGTYGKLIFASATTTSGSSNSHFLDGYGGIRTTATFTLPVGQAGVLAPITITPSSTTAIDAAYFRAAPSTQGSTLDTNVGAISPVEYWHVLGTNNAVIGLTWRATSNLSTFVSPVSNVTLAGFDGTKWVALPSVVAGTLSAGTVISSAAINLNTYKFFTIASQKTPCQPLLASSGSTKIWTGASWTGGTPTLSDPAVLAAAYNGGSFSCNSLTNAGFNITLSDGQFLEVVNGFSGTGKIIMSSEASVVQRDKTAAAPSIELTKKTRSVMRRYDYVYWGTPISGDFFSQLAAAKASTASVANAFDTYYKYQTGTGGGWVSLNATTPGIGFIARIRPQAPFINATATDFINLKFTGVANNGDVSVPITNNPALTNGGSSHVLLANPYPSAIDADKFLVENSNIDGVIYIWTSATSNPGTVTNYSQSDYIAYTKAGVVLTSGIPTTFAGKIASGQAFKVKSLVNSGNVTFTNCMRLTTDNNQFFKSSQNAPVTPTKDSFKLSMTGDNGVFSQILVAYMPEASLGYDRLYDAGRNSVSTAQLFSVFEDDGRKLSINARPVFDEADTVPLGITKSNTTNETFTIAISDQEGIFSQNQKVYLQDLSNNTYHDFGMGNFSFTANTIAVADRFKIVYNATALANTQFGTADVFATISKNILSVKANQAIVGVEVFDMVGKKIMELKVDNELDFSTPFTFSQAIYIVKAKLENGFIATSKLINNK